MIEIIMIIYLINISFKKIGYFSFVLSDGKLSPETEHIEIFGGRIKSEDIPKDSEGCIAMTNHSKYLHYLIPDCETTYGGYVIKLNESYIKINSDGIRDYDNITVEKSDNTIRIISLGDSTTFGMGVNLSYTYPKILEELLDSGNFTSNFEVLNFGVPSFNTKEEVLFFEDKGIKYQPDLVTVLYICNDFEDNFLSYEIGKNITKEYMSTNNLVELSNLDRKIINSAGAREIRMYTEKHQEFFWKKIVSEYFLKLQNLSKSQNFDVMIIYFKCYWPYANEKEKLIELSRDLGFPLLDLSEFNQRKRPDLYLRYPDGHLNERGNRLYAEQIYDFIINDMKNSLM